MQMQRRAADARRGAVDGVADDREAHLGAVHAQLMRAPGDGLKRKPGDLSFTSPWRGRVRLPKAIRSRGILLALRFTPSGGAGLPPPPPPRGGGIQPLAGSPPPHPLCPPP